MAKKGGGNQTVTTTPDQFGDMMRRKVFEAANAAATSPVPGVNPLTTEAEDLYRGFTGGGNLGFGALTGDAEALEKFMSPYTKSVLDEVRSGYGDIRADTIAATNDAATRAGAFGGSRHGVAEGLALGQVAKDQAAREAELLNAGYSDAMARAAQAANLGFGATGALAGLGEYERNVALSLDPALRRFQLLLQAQSGTPQHGTNKQTGAPGTNPIGAAFGGAATGMGAFGPAGAVAGGLLGLLGVL